MSKKKFQSLFFDLDHTLWDFDLNSRLTLEELCEEFSFVNKFENFEKDIFIDRFNQINHQLWDSLNHNRISVESLRTRRLEFALEPFGKVEEKTMLDFNELYLTKCPFKTNLMPRVAETLEFLYDKGYKLYVLTNGFEHIQYTKLISSGIFHYFEYVVTFNDTGVRKPDTAFFDFALGICKTAPENCLMIGDNPLADLLGAGKLNISTAWYNPLGLTSPFVPDYELSCLSELKNIV